MGVLHIDHFCMLCYVGQPLISEADSLPLVINKHFHLSAPSTILISSSVKPYNSYTN
jgi:hypothetical protein